MAASAASEASGSDEGIRAAAAAALADVDSLEVSEADRPVVLRALLEFRLGLFDRTASRYLPQDDTPRDPATHSNKALKVVEPLRSDDMLGKIAAGLKLDRDKVEQVYAEVEGELDVVISPRRLASDKANATRQLAQILAAGRQLAGIDSEWTPVGKVRETVGEFGKLDGGNFDQYIGTLNRDDACVLKGKGASREIKVTRAGRESIGEMINALLSE